MKKFLFFVATFFSLTLFNNIKAATINLHYDSTWTNNIITGVPLDDINNELIPFIEENMQDYIVILLLDHPTNNNNHYSMHIFLAEKDTTKIPSVQSSNRTGYVSGLTLAQVGSINGDGFASSYLNQKSTNFNYYFSSTNDNDYFEFGSVSHFISNVLQPWLSNPIFKNNSFFDQWNVGFYRFTGVDSDVDVELFDGSDDWGFGLTYYSNTPLRIITSTNWQSRSRYFIVNYEENLYEYHYTYLFPFYKDFVSLNTYLPPTTFSYGDGQYAFTSNQIVINDLNGNADIVKCPQNTDFVNDFCYTNRHSYTSTADMPNSRLNVSFDMLGAVPFYENKYYVLTYRTHLVNTYLPTSASISSGNISMPIQIVKTNVINNGLYTDIQVVLKASQSFGSNEPYEIRNLSLLYPTIASSEPENYEEWYYGFYKVYKMSYFDNVPTTTQLDNDYKINDIDSVGNNNSNSSWFNKFKVNDRGLSNIVKAPITLFQSMRNTSCSNIVLPLPHFGNITLPCISSILNDNVPTLVNIYQIIVSGIICYYIGLNYFRIIKNSFTPDNDRIEVQDL